MTPELSHLYHEEILWQRCDFGIMSDNCTVAARMQDACRQDACKLGLCGMQTPVKNTAHGGSKKRRSQRSKLHSSSFTSSPSWSHLNTAAAGADVGHGYNALPSFEDLVMVMHRHGHHHGHTECICKQPSLPAQHHLQQILETTEADIM